MPVEKPTCDIIMGAIVIFALPVNVYETIKMISNRMYDLQKWVNIMSYNIAEYVVGWRFNSLHNGETMADLSQTVFVRYKNGAFKWTNTHKHTNTQAHTHTHTYTHTRTHSDALQWARMQCVAFSLKSSYRLTPIDISCQRQSTSIPDNP